MGARRGVATVDFSGGEGSELQRAIAAKVIAKLKEYKFDKVFFFKFV